jgi:diguanylate cyclase (GGDEF)-like protein
MTSPQSIGEVLIAALPRLRAATLAFVAASREQVQMACAGGVDESGARSMVKRVAEAFILECEDRDEVILRNRVREIADGPLIGRFLVVPVRDDTNKLLGIVIAFRAPDDEEFAARESRLAESCSRAVTASMFMSRDALTGLMLPADFEKRVAPYLAASATTERGAILFGNIDQLRLVNELWGMELGDKVILAVARQLQKTLEPQRAAALSRTSSDRFAVFVPSCSLTEAQEIAAKLRDAVSEISIATAAEPLTPKISWGVSSLRTSKHGLAHSMAAAENACRNAKALGGNRVESHSEGEAALARRRDDLLIVNRLRAALDTGQFEIMGQPINSLLRQEVERRYEMLVRIADEDDRLIAPAQFLPAATRYQLLPKLDRAVISQVLGRMGEASRHPGFLPLQASFNLSGPTISDAGFVDWLTAQINASGIPGKWLSFELSEAAARANPANTQSLMQKLGVMGCRFVLDNFGSGSSPLGELRTLNFSSIKIDSSLVRDMLTDARAESLVRGIASLANTLGLATIAEHVETPQVCMRLIEMQVQFGQGFAIGRPIRLDKIIGPALAPPLAKSA